VANGRERSRPINNLIKKFVTPKTEVMVPKKTKVSLRSFFTIGSNILLLFSS